MTVRKGLLGKSYEYNELTASIDASGNTTANVAVDYAADFINPPSVFIVPQLGSPATLTVSDITISGFELSISSETARSIDVMYLYFAHEQL